MSAVHAVVVQKARWQLLWRDGRRCALCGCPVGFRASFGAIVAEHTIHCFQQVRVAATLFSRIRLFGFEGQSCTNQLAPTLWLVQK